MKKTITIIFSFVTVLMLASAIVFYNSEYYIEIKGSTNMTVPLYGVYEEEGAVTVRDEEVEPIGTVDTGLLGEQIVKYCHGNVCRERKVKVVDDIEPVVELIGSGEINILLNGNYIEKGATASDNYDGDLTDNIEIISDLKLEEPGEYKITYKVKDSSGNIGINYRVVNVIKDGPLNQSLKDFSLKGYFDGTILKETEDAGWNYVLDTIFFGDSITENMGWYLGDLPEANVWAIHNLTPANAMTWEVPFNKYNEKITLAKGMAKYKPKRIIIQLGANSVGISTKDYFISTYETLIKTAKEASPDSIIIVESVFPVGAKYDGGNSLNNTKINYINYYLAEMCERLGVYFLNTAEVLKNSAGTMNLNYCYSSDNIHLLSPGNQALLRYVRTHAVFTKKNN